MSTKKAVKTVALLSVVALMGGLAACGGGGSASAEDDKTLVLLDGYTHHPEGSAWDKLVYTCVPEGYTLKRQSQKKPIDPLTIAVKENNAPDIAVLDNPTIPTAVDAGLIVDINEAGVNTEGFDENIQGPGFVDGKQYAITYGANTVGLYYKPDVLKSAGVDPASITDWDSLNAAIQKVVDAGHGGIVFSGISSEEGVFQFLPWFWGAGGSLEDIDSDAANEARDLMAGWVKNGWAPKSSLTDTQSAAWDVFLSGDYGFAENGSWQAQSASEQGYEMLPIPTKDGSGAAPVPTGGEFMVIPYQKDLNKDKQKAAADFITCMTTDKLLESANATGYFASKESVREQQLSEEAYLQPWSDAVKNARGRTTELGLQYETISSELSEKLTEALNG